MKDKIEKKINSYIGAILRKEHIDHTDYKVLSEELSRINAKEQAKKWEDETDERNEKMAQLMYSAFGK